MIVFTILGGGHCHRTLNSSWRQSINNENDEALIIRIRGLAPQLVNYDPVQEE